MVEIEKKIEFTPNYSVHPGETLQEILAIRGITQAELATRIGRPLKTVNEIAKGKASLTAETALQLERALDLPAELWNALEAHHQLLLAQQRESARIESYSEWLSQLPLKELKRRGILSPVKDRYVLIKEALRFFGIDSPDNLALSSTVAAFRKSPTYSANDLALHTWLRIGERAAQELHCQPFDKTAFRQVLDQIRKLSMEKDLSTVKTQLIEMCRSCGVAVVFVSALDHTHVSGAARWLTSEKALIQMSCRHKTDDHVWFTFFHEAAHILLHGKKEGFLDDKITDTEKEEREANLFAANLLIPSHAMNNFVRQRPLSKEKIAAFAEELEISPGIIVGQLQWRKRLPPVTSLNKLKKAGYDLTLC